MKALLLSVGLVGCAALLGRSLYGTVTSGDPEPTFSYDSHGRTKSSIVYVDGVKQGQSEQWHDNGLLEAQGRYEAGLREGAWSFWNEHGSIDAERSGEYRAGRRIGGLGAR